MIKKDTHDDARRLAELTLGGTGTIGIDEVGRGPLSGPITVCACYIEDETRVSSDIFRNTIMDSKKINKTLRYNIYQTIRLRRYTGTKIVFSIHSRSAAYIDRYGIKLATRECVRACMQGLRKQGVDIFSVMIRTDAGLSVPMPRVSQCSFIRGDEKFVDIALASILAKEHRDGYMRKLAKRHPEYGWEKNMGYGTARHRQAIRSHGFTKFHRISYIKGIEQFDKAD
jgi:ribonuclease HII